MCIRDRRFVGHRPLTGTLAVSKAGRASAAGYLTCPRFLVRVILPCSLSCTYKTLRRASYSPATAYVLYVSTTAAVLLYRCIYVAIVWVGGLVDERVMSACV